MTKTFGEAKMTFLVDQELRAAEIAQHRKPDFSSMSINERQGWRAHEKNYFALSMKRRGQEAGWLARQIFVTRNKPRPRISYVTSASETDPAFMRDEFAPLSATWDVGYEP